MIRNVYIVLVAVAVYWYLLMASLPLPSLPGTAHPPAPPTQESRGVFISGTSAGDAETLNWILAADGTSLAYAGYTLDSLATYDNDWNVQLRCAAKDVAVSEDGLVYTVTIRDDLKWSDGSPVTAEDYVYTMKNLMCSDWLNYPYRSDWQEEVNGQTVFITPRVVDETTFTITRQTVKPDFIYDIRTLTPYPEYIATKYEGDIDAFTQAPEFNNLTYTGNLGPYKFVEWIRNDKLVLERNPEYYLGQDTGAPYFEQRIVKILGTPAIRHAALEAGDVTYAGIDPAQVAKFQQIDRIRVYTLPTTGYLLMNYNLRDNGWEGLRQQKLRQALSLAVSKELLIEKVLLGFGEPAYSFIPKTSPWYVDEGIAKYGVGPLRDKEKARELFLEAGYAARKADGSIQIQDKAGNPLKLTLVTNTGNEVNENVGHLVKEELADIGIEVELKFIPWATELRKYLMNKVPGTDQEPRYNNGAGAVSEEPWDLMVIIFSTNPLAPSGQNVFLATDGGLNFSGYADAQVDRLFQRLQSKEALDEGARKGLYAELSRLVADEQPADFLAFQLATVGFQKNVQGVEPGINMGYNSYLWYFE